MIRTAVGLLLYW